MPIMGERRITRSGRVSAGLQTASMAWSRAKAPPFENPTMCSGRPPARRLASRTASRVAAAQSGQVTRVSAAGTVPWPGRRMPSAVHPLFW